MRARVKERARAEAWDNARLEHAFEEESVRQSMDNLRSYPIIGQAITEGKLDIHGWIINTATQRILEMNPETLAFEPMAKVI